MQEKIIKNELPDKEKIITITEKMLHEKWIVDFYFSEYTQFDEESEESFEMDISIEENLFPKEKILEYLSEVNITFEDLKISRDRGYATEWRYNPPHWNVSINLELKKEKRKKKK